MTKVTNLSKATEMVKASVDARIPKSEIIAQLVAELNISKANAFVYFTKASKALGFTITKDKGATKVAAPAEGVTVVKDGKRVTKAKVKELADEEKVAAFFENAQKRMAEKAKAQPASVFAALGV
jgi:hypothetical protein